MSIDTKFPDVDGLFERAAVTETQIGVNPNLFQQLGCALGIGGKSNAPLVLHPVSTVTPMRVQTSGGLLGVIMPASVSGVAAS
jgi:hypothetical protein